MLGLKFAHALSNDRVPSTQAWSPHLHIFFEMEDGSSIAFSKCPARQPPRRTRTRRTGCNISRSKSTAKRSCSTQEEAGGRRRQGCRHHRPRLLPLDLFLRSERASPRDDDPHGHGRRSATQFAKEADAVLKVWQKRKDSGRSLQRGSRGLIAPAFRCPDDPPSRGIARGPLRPRDIDGAVDLDHIGHRPSAPHRAGASMCASRTDETTLPDRRRATARSSCRARSRRAKSFWKSPPPRGSGSPARRYAPRSRRSLRMACCSGAARAGTSCARCQCARCSTPMWFARTLKGSPARSSRGRGLSDELRQKLLEALELGDTMLRTVVSTDEMRLAWREMNERFHRLILEQTSNACLIDVTGRTLALPFVSSRVAHFRQPRCAGALARRSLGHLPRHGRPGQRSRRSDHAGAHPAVTRSDRAPLPVGRIGVRARVTGMARTRALAFVYKRRRRENPLRSRHLSLI